MSIEYINKFIDDSIETLNFKSFSYTDMYIAKKILKEILYAYDEIPTDIGFITYLNGLIDVLIGKEIK